MSIRKFQFHVARPAMRCLLVAGLSLPMLSVRRSSTTGRTCPD